MVLNPQRLIRKFSSYFRPPEDTLITLRPDSNTIRGRVLLSYLIDGISNSYDDEKFSGHSNVWESREIARIFVSLGYVVDAIDYRNQNYLPKVKYDVVFDISTNLQRLARLMDNGTIKILHLTGSNPYYHNRAQLNRIKALQARRKQTYSPQRLVPWPELTRKSLEVADVCALMGNEHTLQTYPEQFKDKMHLVTVSASYLGDSIKSRNNLVPNRREFLWFFGTGAVHKGLDLVLEAFSRNRQLVLNIVGNVEGEADFIKIYSREIYQVPSIRYHGYLNPASAKFRDVVKNVFCFVAPSCSEAISSAVATCMQAGLFPIISRDTGATLPTGCGTYLEKCSISEIESAVLCCHRMSESTLREQISRAQKHAMKNYSRENFRLCMENFIEKTIAEHR